MKTFHRRPQRLSVSHWEPDLVELRYDVERMLATCHESVVSLESLLRRKRKKYTQDELSNKADRLERVKDNLEVLRDLFIDQNAFEQVRLGVRPLNDDDLEKQMVFVSKEEMNKRAEKYKREEDSDGEVEDAFRELNDYEKELMDKFERNDHEIDDMLDGVILQVEGLKLYGEQLGTAI